MSTSLDPPFSLDLEPWTEPRYEPSPRGDVQAPPPLRLAAAPAGTPSPAIGPVATAPVVAALGVAIVAISFAMERTATATRLADPVFWVGFLTLAAPILWRLLSAGASRAERLLLLGTFGALSYGIKVLRDPLTLVMSDEFNHFSATEQVARTHSLFPAPVLYGGHVAVGYPGLHVTTVAIADITGLSLFVSALIVIALAKVIVMLALFHLFERVSGSARMAGLGAVLFAANSNFLFWSAQFSYESLALPLFIVALYLFLERGDAGYQRLSYTVALVLLTLTIAATHHVTTYALALVFWVLTVMAWRRGPGSLRAVGLASFATVLSVAWFFLIAPSTSAYLGYIISESVGALRHVLGAHAPFQASAASLQTPRSEEAIAFLGVAIVGLGVLATLIRRRRHPALNTDLGILLAVASVGCIALYPLRALPDAWETANRAQEFLFVGVAFVLGLAVAAVRIPRLRSTRPRALLVLGMLVIIAGGVIEGWPAPLRLSPPLFVKDGSHTITPQGFTTARWATRRLARRTVYVGDEATARELAVDGAHFTYFGDSGSPFAQILQSATFPAWQRRLLAGDRVDDLLVDDRRIADNDQAAFFFEAASDPSGGAGYFPAGARAKYTSVPGVSLISDSGDVVVFDVSALHAPPPACAAVGTPSLIDGLTCATATGTLTAPADGVVTLDGVQVRYLGAFAQRLTDGLWLSMTVQMANEGTRPFRPLADARATELLAGDAAFLPQTTVPFHSANLATRRTVDGQTAVIGTLSFLISGRASTAAVLAGGAGLSLPSPGGDRHQVAWIPAGRPRLIGSSS